MRLQDEETDDHAGERLAEQRMLTRIELLEGDEIIIRLTHFLTGNRDHIIVHPVVHRVMTKGRARLRNLCLVVGEHKVHATAMDIKLLAKIFRTHSRTFHMPSRETF